jgi:thiaminase (transcriptional activator TenA)
MAELDGSPENAPVAPTTCAYVSYLMATVLGGSYPEAVGAVLPCYWIAARVGEALLAARSPDPLYARWIAMYGGEAFQAVVDAVLAEADRVGAGAVRSGLSNGGRPGPG